jgi:hypothetical protein
MILTDAHLLQSNDLDFARFRGLKWANPIATG